MAASCPTWGKHIFSVCTAFTCCTPTIMMAQSGCWAWRILNFNRSSPTVFQEAWYPVRPVLFLAVDTGTQWAGLSQLHRTSLLQLPTCSTGLHKAFCKTTSHCFFNFPHACMHAQLLIHVRLSVTPWAVAHQAPLSMEFSRQEYWSGLPFPTQWIFPAQGLNLHLLHLLPWQVDSLSLHHLGSPNNANDLLLVS